MPRNRPQRKAIPKKAASVIAGFRQDIHSLNSSVLIIGQKMKYLVRNEKILGRNLIVLNKKHKAFEAKIVSGEIGGKAGTSEMSAEVEARVKDLERKNIELQAQLDSFKQGLASQEQLQELKYVIDSINPLELATLEQVKELIAEKKGKRKQA